MSIVSQVDIQRYLPQHPPFLMVDSLEAFDEKNASSFFLVKDSNPLVEKTILTEAGMLENIAQTCALHSGYYFQSQQEAGALAMDKSIAPVGFIGAIKDFQLFFPAKVGDVLKTSMVIEHQISNASVIKGEIKINEQVAARCEMKIFLQ